MASGDTGNVVPGNRLRVRVPCPPLSRDAVIVMGFSLCICGVEHFKSPFTGGSTTRCRGAGGT
jgi:hypothetical protein